MTTFKGLTEAQIMEKILQYEKDDFDFEWDTSVKSEAYITKRCEKDRRYVIVVGYLQAEFLYRTAEYRPIIQRYWCVMNEDGICTSVHMRYWAARNEIGIRDKTKPYAPRKTDDEAMAMYNKACSGSNYPKDAGNCGPLAIATASGLSYDYVRNVALGFGYDPKKGGMKVYEINRLMKELGIVFEDVTNEIREIVKTTKSFEKRSIQGRYVLIVDGHALAAVNGTICDFSWNENRRIIVARKIISVNKVKD